MPVPVQDIAHVEEGLERLIDQFAQQGNIRNLLTSYLNRFQELENVIFDVINLRLLDNATGANLDVVGRIVGEPRLGRADFDYRKAIRIRILVNRSQGTAENVLTIAERFFGFAVAYTEGGSYPACFDLTVEDITALDVIYFTELLKAARMGGVRAVFTYTVSTPAFDLLFDDASGPGVNVPHPTFLDDATTPGSFNYFFASSEQV